MLAPTKVPQPTSAVGWGSVWLRFLSCELVLTHARLERVAAAGLLLGLTAIGGRVVRVEPSGFLGSELDFEITAEDFGSEDMGTWLNRVGSDPEHDILASRYVVNRFERHTAVGNGVHRT